MRSPKTGLEKLLLLSAVRGQAVRQVATSDANVRAGLTHRTTTTMLSTVVRGSSRVFRDAARASAVRGMAVRLPPPPRPPPDLLPIQNPREDPPISTVARLRRPCPVLSLTTREPTPEPSDPKP